jgi:hypothetical protein
MLLRASCKVLMLVIALLTIRVHYRAVHIERGLFESGVVDS